MQLLHADPLSAMANILVRSDQPEQPMRLSTDWNIL